MSTLDQIAVSIEITLISMIEGFALQFLASSATPLLRDTSMLVYVPYALAGLLFLLVFWSQSILHAVSFIRWPVRVGHMFMYFTAAFVQVVAYAYLTDPLRWFFWGTVFSIVIAILYGLDLRLIRDSKETFAGFEGGSEFLAKVERRHRYEFRTLVPLTLAFNGFLFLLLFFAPSYFATTFWYGLFGVLEVLVCAGALINGGKNFRERTHLISVLFKEK